MHGRQLNRLKEPQYAILVNHSLIGLNHIGHLSEFYRRFRQARL